MFNQVLKKSLREKLVPITFLLSILCFVLCIYFNSNQYRTYEYNKVASSIQDKFLEYQNQYESYSLELSIKQGKFVLSDFTRYADTDYNMIFILNNEIKFWSSRVFFPENILDIVNQQGDQISIIGNKKYYIKQERLTPEESLVFVFPFSNSEGEIYFSITNSDSFTVNANDGIGDGYKLENLAGETLSKFYLKRDSTGSNSTELQIFWWLFLVFFVFAIFNFLKTNKIRYNGIHRIFILIGALFLVKLFIGLDPFNNLEEFSIFHPYVYSNQIFGSSIGIKIINIYFIFLILNLWYSSKSPLETNLVKASNTKRIAIATAFIALSYVYFFYIYRSLILDSSPEIIFFETSSLPQFFLFGLIIVCGMLFFFFFLRIVRIFNLYIIEVKDQIKLCIASGLISFLLFLVSFNLLDTFVFSLFLSLSLGLLLYILRAHNQITNISQALLCIFLCAIITNYGFSTFNAVKKEHHIKDIAVKISIEQDHYSYPQLNNLPKIISEDNRIRESILSEKPNLNVIQNIISTNYLTGEIDNYRVELKVDSIENLVSNINTDIQPKVGNYNKFEYFINIPFFSDDGLVAKNLEIYLVETKLLSDYSFYKRYQNIKNEKRLPNFPIFNEINYSILKNDEVIYSKGEFINLNKFKIGDLKLGELRKIGQGAYAYKINESDCVIIQVPYQKIPNKELIRFSYVFSCIILSYLILVLFKSKFRLKKIEFFNQSFSNRIQFILLSSLYFVSIFIVATSVIILKKSSDSIEINEYKTFINLVNESYKQHIALLNVTDHNKEFNNFITNNFNIFTSDLVFYSNNGHLVYTKEPILFEDKVWPKFIDPIVWDEIMDNQSQLLIIDENLFKVDYSGLYLAIRDDQLNVNGILYVPTFDAPFYSYQSYSLFNNALYSIFSVALFVLTLLIFIGTRSFIQVLSKVRDRISSVNLGINQRLLDWNYDDEIGLLISEYNNMVIKLDENAVLLARNERESAWREVAKQIAHEIKNPLTPMKLSIQHLKFKLKHEGKEQSIEYSKTLDTLVSQMDHLSAIADGFSNIAKMDVPDLVVFDLKDIFYSVVEIFDNQPEYEFKFEDLTKSKTALVLADSTMMNSVFTNIIKNSIQALVPERKGIIQITISELDHYYEFIFYDNGKGIKQKDRPRMFTPNFSTKTTGKGIGLMMVKKIIDLHEGDISFNSVENEFTEFTIKFKKAEFSSKDLDVENKNN